LREFCKSYNAGVTVFAMALLQLVSYSRDIAPVLAFHCNQCHGDEGIAGGVDTRTYESFRKTTNLDLMLELLEGRRGEARRMPKDAPAFEAAMVNRFRLWIAAGATEDQDQRPAPVIRRVIARQPVFRLRVEAAGESYVTIELRDLKERLLHREAGVVRTAREWEVLTARQWPERLLLVLTARYAANPVKLVIAD
jgi:hypothetical protein